jgi:hypothetical protein
MLKNILRERPQHRKGPGTSSAWMGMKMGDPVPGNIFRLNEHRDCHVITG